MQAELMAEQGRPRLRWKGISFWYISLSNCAYHKRLWNLTQEKEMKRWHPKVWRWNELGKRWRLEETYGIVFSAMFNSTSVPFLSTSFRGVLRAHEHGRRPARRASALLPPKGTLETLTITANSDRHIWYPAFSVHFPIPFVASSKSPASGVAANVQG